MTKKYLPAWTGPGSPQSPVPVPACHLCGTTDGQLAQAYGETVCRDRIDCYRRQNHLPPIPEGKQ